MILAGRGWGKTRVGAEDIAHYGLTNPGVRIAVVAPTYPDARDTCVEGESGLLKCLPPECVSAWNRSLGELILTNGSQYKLLPACEPERFRGPQHHRAWCDEVGSWTRPEAWDMLMFGLRLGNDPRVIITTTPKPTKLIKDILAAQSTHVTRGNTFENRKNLAPAFFDEIVAKYEGTRLGRQELYAEVLEDVVGALWSRAQIDNLKVVEAPRMKRIVVAIDPAVTSSKKSDETGIVVAGLGVDDHGYLLEDLSGKHSTDTWARIAVEAYRRHGADRIVAEVNNGGDLVENVLRTVDKSISYRSVHASKGKIPRAEPVAALYEQGRVHHVGSYVDLEDQMVTYTGSDNESSPDRMDALVWAFSDLMIRQTITFERVITR